LLNTKAADSTIATISGLFWFWSFGCSGGAIEFGSRYNKGVLSRFKSPRHQFAAQVALEVGAMHDTLALVLAGGRGERLDPLTRDRAKPAVPFGGAYRIIDFTLSNCLNSGLRKILLVTQFKSMSLDRHVNLGWRRFFCREMDEFLDIVPPQQRIDRGWYAGTADAVYQNIYTIEKEQPEYVMVLAGDHIYKMDYAEMIQSHKDRDADLTIGVLRVGVDEARQFGVMQINSQQRVVGFEEKPADPKPLPDDRKCCLASMGIYVFTARFLYEQLLQDANLRESAHDFGKNIIPSIIRDCRVFAFPFTGVVQPDEDLPTPYWRDVGTLDAFYEANMDLVSVKPELNLYDPHWPIRTYQRVLPPPKFVFRGNYSEPDRVGHAVDSLVCSGCIVSGGYVEGSILGPQVRINSFADVRESILFDGVDVGRNCRIRRAIIDKQVTIPPGTEIGYDPKQDHARGFKISPNGVVVIPKADSPLAME
jgi:glucose-1-phosphate adenylyltransferase